MAFDDVPRTPEGHVRLHLYAAIVHLAATLRRVAGRGDDDGLDRTVEAHPFLGGYLETAAAAMPDDVAWHEAPAWWRLEIRSWEEGLRPVPPLVALGLSAHARIALAAALLVEEDARFPAAFAALDGGRTRPTVEALALVAWAGTPPDGAARRVVTELDGVAVPTRPEDPLPVWELRISPALVTVLRGDDPPVLPQRLSLARPEDLAPLAGLPLAPTTRAAATGAVAALRLDRRGALVVRGPAGADRGRVVDAIARELGRPRLTLRLDADLTVDPEAVVEAGAVARATGALVRVDVDLPPGERVRLPSVPGHEAPLLVAATASGSLTADGPVLTVTVDPLGPEQRRAVWRQAWRGVRVRRLDEIARTHRLADGWIRQVAADAAAIAARDGRRSVGPADVREALAAVTNGALEQLATPLPGAPHGFGDLVVAARSEATLADLATWIRRREEVAAAARTPTAGVRALFSGPSGTGKTLAARALATEVGLACYRMDLASVVSKYIGETEKNLDQLLTRAEELDVLLLLDEGDALLGARTDVRSANDRYANLETNYLLQRLETFEGTFVVTTNVGKQIDPAFQRRMDVVVEFAPPGVAARNRLWELHLPAGHHLEPPDLASVAQRHALTGGQIRNASLRATLRALTEDRPVAPVDVDTAVAEELVKAGALAPGRGEARPRGVERFLEALP